MPKKISKGDRGDEVARWQTMLSSLGFDPNGIDGRFGTGTGRATREFQRAQGLEPDGIVGRKTWAAAEAATAAPTTIRKASRGPDVERWQRLLSSLGFDPNGIDGRFGNGTEKATKKFQQAHGLEVDGIVGTTTWSAALTGNVVAEPPPKKPAIGAKFLKDRIDISKVPLAPTAKAAGRDAGVVRAWNRYGGVLTRLSGELGIDPDSAAAVLAIESGGSGMTASGPTIRFENHIFFDRWGKANTAKFNAHFSFDSTKRWRGHKWRRSANGAWQTCHKEGQADEWNVFRFAAGLDENAAITSMSIGLAQIMGFHYQRIGYGSPRQMLDAFSAGEGAQILGFFDFVDSSSGNRLTKAIQTKDWYTFAKGYNGTGKFRDYGDKMKAAYAQLQAAK